MGWSIFWLFNWAVAQLTYTFTQPSQPRPCQNEETHPRQQHWAGSCSLGSSHAIANLQAGMLSASPRAPYLLNFVHAATTFSFFLSAHLLLLPPPPGKAPGRISLSFSADCCARHRKSPNSFLATRRWLEKEDFIFWGCFQSLVPLGVRAICPRWELCVRCNFNLVENWGCWEESSGTY